MLKKNPNYGDWNSTAVSHMCLAASGINGEEARELGLELLNGYIEYKKVNQSVTDGLFFGNPTSEFAQEYLVKANELYDDFKKRGITLQEFKDETFSALNE